MTYREHDSLIKALHDSYSPTRNKQLSDEVRGRGIWIREDLPGSLGRVVGKIYGTFAALRAPIQGMVPLPRVCGPQLDE